jgi:hypothetical protein
LILPSCRLDNYYGQACLLTRNDCQSSVWPLLCKCRSNLEFSQTDTPSFPFFPSARINSWLNSSLQMSVSRDGGSR